MYANQGVTATFAVPRTLKVSVKGRGSGSVTSRPAGISCPGACSVTFGQGSRVTLRPTVKSGSAFAGWSGAGCTGPSSCVFTLRSNVGVSATLGRSSGAGPPASTGSGVSNIVWCAAPFRKYCYFTETLTTVETLNGGNVSTIRAAGKGQPATKTVVVGTKKVKVRGGHTVLVTVPLDGTGQQFLKQFGNVPVTVKVELLRAGKQATIAKRKLTVKPKHTKKKKKTSQRDLSRSAPSVAGALDVRAAGLHWPAL